VRRDQTAIRRTKESSLMTEQEYQKMLIRVPRDLKTWLEQEARRNLSSQASEIVRSVRERKERSGNRS
jgi:hypothetical protein